MILLLACVQAPERHVDPSRRYGEEEGGADEEEEDGAPPARDTDPEEGEEEAEEEEEEGGPCPSDMELVGATCMDRHEAPNRAGELPLVMYTFDEAEAWCAARDKTLCPDSTWEQACAGADERSYPYGDSHRSGVCNDDETWLTYSQSTLNAWPSSASATDVEGLEELLDRAAASSSTAAEHVEELYQGEGSGDNAGCVGDAGVYDLVGNVEEWTRRADGGTTSFHGNLKGRYWAESRTCQSDVTVHGDSFRFYEIGFRCCLPAEK